MSLCAHNAYACTECQCQGAYENTTVLCLQAVSKVSWLKGTAPSGDASLDAVIDLMAGAMASAVTNADGQVSLPLLFPFVNEGKTRFSSHGKLAKLIRNSCV